MATPTFVGVTSSQNGAIGPPAEVADGDLLVLETFNATTNDTSFDATITDRGWTITNASGTDSPGRRVTVAVAIHNSASPIAAATYQSYCAISAYRSSTGWLNPTLATSLAALYSGANTVPLLAGTSAGDGVEVLAVGNAGPDVGGVRFSFTGFTEQFDSAIYTSLGLAGADSLARRGASGSFTVASGNLSVGVDALFYAASPPNAPTLTSPPNNGTLNLAVPQQFGVLASHPDVGDSQSAMTIYYRQGAGAWVPVADITPNPYHVFPPGTFAAGLWEWQAETTNQRGVTGPRSASNWFTAASSPGVPAITAPVNGATVLNTATLTWSVTAQTAYQYRRVADLAGAADPNTVYFDSGEITNSATRSLTVTYPVNNRYEHTQVRIKTELWSSWADSRNPVSWTAPMVPTVACTPYPLAAEILIAVTNPAVTGGAPATSYSNIYISSPLDPEYRAATWVPPNSAWPWKTPASGRIYTIRAEAVGTNGTTASSLPEDTTVTDGGTPSTPPELVLDGGTP